MVDMVERTMAERVVVFEFERMRRKSLKPLC